MREKRNVSVCRGHESAYALYIKGHVWVLNNSSHSFNVWHQVVSLSVIVHIKVCLYDFFYSNWFFLCVATGVFAAPKKRMLLVNEKTHFG